MSRVHEKALQFLTALLDVYRDEEDRELDAFPKIPLNEDFTQDMTAILLALSVFVERLSNYDGDLIDLTHMLNKLAVQHIMERQEADPDEWED